MASDHTGSTRNTGQGDDSLFLRLPDGDCKLRLRLLPGKPGGRPYAMYQAHKLSGRLHICRRVPERTLERTLWVAPKEGDDCPVCAYWKTKYRKYNPGKPPKDVEDMLREIKPICRVSWNVIARDYNGNKNVGPLVWTCGILLARKIWNRIVGDVANGRKGLGDIFDPKTGRDFLLVKQTKGGSQFPEYGESDLLDPSPAGTAEE